MKLPFNQRPQQFVSNAAMEDTDEIPLASIQLEEMHVEMSDDEHLVDAPNQDGKHSSHVGSTDTAWILMETHGIGVGLCKRPILFPLYAVFAFVYFGFLNVILYYMFSPAHVRPSEAMIPVILGPLSLVFSNAEFKFRIHLDKLDVLYRHRPSLLAGPSKSLPQIRVAKMSTCHKVKVFFWYFVVCYPIIPGLFRHFRGDQFIGTHPVAVYIFVYNVVFGGIYVYLIALSMWSLKFLIQAINTMAKQSARANIHNLLDLDDWNDDFLNFQNTLENISRGIEFPITFISVVVVLLTALTILVTIQVKSILFPEWFQMVILTAVLLGFSLYLFYSISSASANMEEALFNLQTAQMFVARKTRKHYRKVTQGKPAEEAHVPPVVTALDYVVRYWSERPKGIILYGIKIDRKTVFSVLGLGASLSITVFNRILANSVT